MTDFSVLLVCGPEQEKSSRTTRRPVSSRRQAITHRPRSARAFGLRAYGVVVSIIPQTDSDKERAPTMFFSSWLQQRAQRWLPRIDNRDRRAGRVPVLTLPTVRPALEVLEDRTLPAPIGSIGLSLFGDVFTSAGETQGPRFDQSKSIDKSVGQVSINGSSSLSGTDGSLAAGYTVTGSATALPPAQLGQPYEGDITIDRNWTFADGFSYPEHYVYPFGSPLGNVANVVFFVPGTFTLTYVTSQSIEGDAFQDGSSVNGIQTLPTTGSGSITLSIPTNGSVYISTGSVGEGGNGGLLPKKWSMCYESL